MKDRLKATRDLLMTAERRAEGRPSRLVKRLRAELDRLEAERLQQLKGGPTIEQASRV